MEENKKIRDNQNSKNRKRHIDNQDKLELRFFLTLEESGGEAMDLLCLLVEADYNNKKTLDRSFYNIVGGSKDSTKKVILDRCLVLIGHKWRKKSPPKEVGKMYEPASFCKMMSNLFVVFERKGIKFDWKRDFNGKGEFHGQMKSKWILCKKKDPTFGTQQRKAQFDIDIDRKCRQKIVEGVIKLYTDPHHLTMGVQFIFGRICAFRGQKEHHDLTHDCVHRGLYSDINGGPELDGLAYYGIKIDNDKMTELGFNTPKVAPDSTHLLTCVETPKDLVFDPVKVLDFYIERCHPEAITFLAKAGTPKQIARWSSEYKREIWYGPAKPTGSAYKLGEKTITSNFKQWSFLAGAEHWEKCTGHGARALCITL